MKKRLLIMFGISVFAGAGYVAWAYTPIGKHVLAGWLLKKWKAIAARRHRVIDVDNLRKELARLSYPDHELLTRLTILAAAKTKKTLPLAELEERKVFERADLAAAKDLLLSENQVT